VVVTRKFLLASITRISLIAATYFNKASSTNNFNSATNHASLVYPTNPTYINYSHHNRLSQSSQLLRHHLQVVQLSLPQRTLFRLFEFVKLISSLLTFITLIILISLKTQLIIEILTTLVTLTETLITLTLTAVII
jgi:hypothetical protein